MKTRSVAADFALPSLALALMTATPAPVLGAPAIPPAPACELAAIGGQRQLHDVLSRRAVDAVGRAGGTHWKTDPALARLVAPDASADLGAGDVGRPLGAGVAGLHALAETMRADSYRFNGWDYLDGPADACDSHEVEVEFVNGRERRSARISFTFKAGRIVSATGWERSLESGAIPPPSDGR